MRTLTVLKKEQKSSLPNLNQVKDFVKNNIKEKNNINRFRDILDRKTGKKSSTYIWAIDNLFSSFKLYIDALAWLNSVLENNFGVTDMPIIDTQTKSDIRSSMITEAVPVRKVYPEEAAAPSCLAERVSQRRKPGTNV